MRNTLYIILGPLLGTCCAFLLHYFNAPRHAGIVGGMAIWMCVWWFTECLSIAVTACIPLIILPLFGISKMSDLARHYSDSIIFLFLGGFMLAFAIEKWGFHLRCALWIISKTGTQPERILAGVMLSAFCISNWISNTATAVMLLSAVLALIDVLKPFLKESKNAFAPALLLGLAFSATIGGMATPVGTPPNMYFYKLYAQHFSQQQALTFNTWMCIGYPISISLLVVCYIVLYIYFLQNTSQLSGHEAALKLHMQALGPMRKEEKRVFAVLVFAILLWITRSDLQFGTLKCSGWSSLLPLAEAVDDGWVALIIALLLFIIPAPSKPGERLLHWEDAKSLRYDVILMFGSGFALAYAFEVSTLSTWIASAILHLTSAPNWILIAGACLLVTLISEFASNIASIQLMIPVLVSLLPFLNILPLQLLWPACFAASLGFMLPIATAANTLVFGTRQIILRDMLRIGLLLDLFGILIILLFTHILN